ncbi:hypothetical protein CRP01_16550 [Flavilitoribacter nigricans DSM 23189 = NBRC 102662]|uniref:Four helix bundle protein n=1 Tax=Flavilitoribacter nigricans (strain ATCC 23147 / DSM 23189 / NBRC 102662 / NCIMB 1420 / SS-2) TaxID=1122177 RepID=A0A2D0NAV2_FLAN2|nr:hypothetical protein CRP01_16550 [Flavilitoribacter nigricans DSM 23189 = NBRC 102662]
MKNFKNLEIWNRSRALTKTIYLLTKTYPQEERFGLVSQLNRASVSIPSNIAEGCGRNSSKQLRHFLNIAIGSICEIETQIYLSFDLGLIPKEKKESLVDEITQIRKMIIGYQRSL